MSITHDEEQLAKKTITKKKQTKKQNKTKQNKQLKQTNKLIIIIIYNLG